MARKPTQKRPGQGSDQFMVRLPDGMRDEIAKQAQQNGRSMNAEIIARLDFSFSELLSPEGLVAVSKRLQAGVVGLERLYFDMRDRFRVVGTETTPPDAKWKGVLRLSLVTCPIALFAGSSDAPLFPPDTNHTIDIDQFIPRAELDPVHIRHAYYLAPEGKAGHEAFAVIRETIRTMNKVAIAWIELGSKRHIFALDARNAGMVAMLLRDPSEIREPAQYFERVQDVHVTRDMLDLSRNIVDRMSGHFDPRAYAAKDAPLNRAAEPSTKVINLMDALRKSAA